MKYPKNNVSFSSAPSGHLPPGEGIDKKPHPSGCGFLRNWTLKSFDFGMHHQTTHVIARRPQRADVAISCRFFGKSKRRLPRRSDTSSLLAMTSFYGGFTHKQKIRTLTGADFHLSIQYAERIIATGRAVPKGLTPTDQPGHALSAATRRISTALRRRE